MRIALLCLICLPAFLPLSQAAESQANRPLPEKIEVEDTDNCYRLDTHFYRSAQPNDEGFADFQKKGIKSVLNLREHHSDNRKAAKTTLKLYHYPVAAGKLTRNDLMECLLTVELAPKPIVIHCWHGSDRTGVVCAAYRIVKQGWPVDDAIREFTDGPFGFHSTFYGNLPALLKSIDWKAFKKELSQKAEEARIRAKARDK